MLGRKNYSIYGNKTPRILRTSVGRVAFQLHVSQQDGRLHGGSGSLRSAGSSGRPPVSKEDQPIFIIPLVDELGQRLISRWENSFLKGYANVERFEGILRGFWRMQGKSYGKEIAKMDAWRWKDA